MAMSWPSTSRMVEALSPEFTTLWVSDHLQFGDAPVLEGWTRLTYLAALFPHLKVGHLVLGQGYRNPALLAKMGATLQYLTGGRFILGIGAGWHEEEYRAYGYGYPSPGHAWRNWVRPSRSSGRCGRSRRPPSTASTTGSRTPTASRDPTRSHRFWSAVPSPRALRVSGATGRRLELGCADGELPAGLRGAAARL